MKGTICLVVVHVFISVHLLILMRIFHRRSRRPFSPSCEFAPLVLTTLSRRVSSWHLLARRLYRKLRYRLLLLWLLWLLLRTKVRLEHRYLLLLSLLILYLLRVLLEKKLFRRRLSLMVLHHCRCARVNGHTSRCDVLRIRLHHIMRKHRVLLLLLVLLLGNMPFICTKHVTLR